MVDDYMLDKVLNKITYIRDGEFYPCFHVFRSIISSSIKD